MSDTPAPNPHTMVMSDNRGIVTCAAEGCYYVSTHYDFPGRTPEENDASAEGIFRMHHSGQYEPGRAPNIAIEYQLVATCSVCPDGGDVVSDSSESVTCNGCGTIWDIDGTDGTRKENDDD